MGVAKKISNIDDEILMFLTIIGCASASTSYGITREECQMGAGLLIHHLLSDESVAEQEEIIKTLVCPQTPDPTGCEADVTKWFPAMAGCMYPHFVIDGDLCSRLGLCPESSLIAPRDITCEECTDILTRIAGFMSEEETIMESVEYLQGECFCGQDGHTDDCADLVSTVVPLALPVLAEILAGQSNQLCAEGVGVCS